MKKHRKASKFLEEIQRVPNISVAVANLGLSRNTIYRWCKEDPKFKKALQVATNMGTDSINDLAESKLVNHIQKGEPWSIKYWLDNHKANYIRPRLAYIWKDPNEKKPKGVDIRIMNSKDEIERWQKLEAYEEKYGPIDLDKPPQTNEVVFRDYSADANQPRPDDSS